MSIVRAAVLLGVVAVSFALRAPRMFDSVWYDEYCRTHGVLNAERLPDLLLRDVHNPLYNALMFGWINVFGDSDCSVRIPSLIAGYASLALFCVVVRKRVDAWTAWFVGAWGLLAPMHVWYSTEAKNNMFVLALCTLALWAMDRMNDRPGVGRAAGAAMAMIAAFYSDLVALLAIIPLLLWPLAVSRKQDDPVLRRRGLGVIAAVSIAAAPWVVFKLMNVGHLWREYLQPFRPREMAELIGGTFVTGHAFATELPARMWASIGVCVAIAPLLVLGARALWKGGRSRVFVVLMMFGMSGMAIVSAIIDAMYDGREHCIYQPRNLLCLFYVFSAILWTGVSRVRPVVARNVVAGLLLGTALSASVVVLTVHRSRITVDKPRSDWEAVARAIDEHADGEQVMTLSRSPVLQLERYSDSIEVETSWGGEIGLAELAEAMEAPEENVELYYVDDLDWFPLEPSELDAWRAAYEVREVARIDRIVVYSLDPH